MKFETNEKVQLHTRIDPDVFAKIKEYSELKKQKLGGAVNYLLSTIDYESLR